MSSKIDFCRSTEWILLTSELGFRSFPCKAISLPITNYFMLIWVHKWTLNLVLLGEDGLLSFLIWRIKSLFKSNPSSLSPPVVASFKINLMDKLYLDIDTNYNFLYILSTNRLLNIYTAILIKINLDEGPSKEENRNSEYHKRCDVFAVFFPSFFLAFWYAQYFASLELFIESRKLIYSLDSIKESIP